MIKPCYNHLLSVSCITLASILTTFNIELNCEKVVLALKEQIISFNKINFSSYKLENKIYASYQNIQQPNDHYLIHERYLVLYRIEWTKNFMQI